MKGTAKIKGLGTVNLSGVSIGNGQIEVHIPVEDVSGQLDRVLDECTSDYMKTYKDVRSGSELNFDVRVVFSYGSTAFENGNNAEFNLFIIVWQQSDDITGRDTAKFYEEIPVAFDSVDTNKIKRIIWDGLGKAVFNL